jgi:hypothetical protein
LLGGHAEFDDRREAVEEGCGEDAALSSTARKSALSSTAFHTALSATLSSTAFHGQKGQTTDKTQMIECATCLLL